MRLFQNARYYPALRPRIRELTRNAPTFKAKIGAFVDFRYSAAHILLPIDRGDGTAFFTNGDDPDLQRVWAREHGMSRRASLVDILKAQIEHHKTEVFYNHDATGWDADFVRSLPGCVKYKIAWHAAPFRNITALAAYDRVVCNFPSILRALQQEGCRVEYFFPAYDAEIAPFAARQDRPVDVLFVGGYTRYHWQRAAVLEQVASLAGDCNIAFHLDRSRLCKLAESPLGRLLPMAKHRRPDAITSIAQPAAFGRDYYELLSRAKIVLNGAIDMAGEDRGNMRCFETLGGGSLLLSDEGLYPEGMKDGSTITTYRSPEHAVEQIRRLLDDSETRLRLASAGHAMVSTLYSKERQWTRFEDLVASIKPHSDAHRMSSVA
ncbi:glycosyltransferase family protein [Bradyrhizobium sp.]|uniref:glycosyltransferase family protein n=1 Tax=Bradyrhizobium sp. TaxID=376 RepID=UPI003C3FF47C